jgi:hypothetical protein
MNINLLNLNKIYFPLINKFLMGNIENLLINGK